MQLIRNLHDISIKIGKISFDYGFHTFRKIDIFNTNYFKSIKYLKIG